MKNMMGINKKKLNLVIIPVIIFLFSFLLRLYFFTGSILGDDIQEFQMTRYIMDNEPGWHDAAHIRFGVWVLNVIAFKLLGVSELSFFLPTLLMSASLAVIGYYILLLRKYPRNLALMAGLFIASAPFEVLLGVVRANDLIFSWFLSMGFLLLLLFEKKPAAQGVLVAVFMWLAFYTKLWAIYLFPVIGIYYFLEFRKGRWQGGASFIAVSLLLHTAIGVFWLAKNGMFFPFIKYHSATYPVAPNDVVPLFSVYPQMVFKGSEFGTTLFGYVPYLLMGLLLLKLALSGFYRKKLFNFDALDACLFAFYMSFFLFLNFFPNTFTFDQYYSAPRIFRYLGPISFPMTLHLVKIIIDFGRTFRKSWMPFRKHFIAVVLLTSN